MMKKLPRSLENSEISSAVVGEGLMPPDVGGDHADDELPPLAAPPPHIEPSGKVIGPDGSYWGKISVLRMGAPNEALSVYCGRHGC